MQRAQDVELRTVQSGGTYCNQVNQRPKMINFPGNFKHGILTFLDLELLGNYT